MPLYFCVFNFCETLYKYESVCLCDTTVHVSFIQPLGTTPPKERRKPYDEGRQHPNGGRAAGRYKLNPVDPWLESA
jgi:hypothetical protein